MDSPIACRSYRRSCRWPNLGLVSLKSTERTRKDMAQNTRILADFFRGTLEQNDMTLGLDEGGNLVLSVKVKPEPVEIKVTDQVQIREEVIAILKRQAEKK